MGRLNLGRVSHGLWPELLRKPPAAVLLWGWVFVLCGIKIAVIGLVVHTCLAAVLHRRARKGERNSETEGTHSRIRIRMRYAYGLAGLGLVAALFILHGRNSFAGGLREVETLTRSDDFRESFLGDLICTKGVPSLSSAGPGVLARAIITLGPKRFVCWEQWDIALYGNDAREVARKPIFELLPDAQLWNIQRVCYSDATTVWFVAGKTDSSGVLHVHGVLKVLLGDAEISGKTCEIDRFSSVAVDAPRDRVFVFRDFDQKCVDVYSMDFREHVRSPLATRYDFFSARCGPSGRLIYLDAAGRGLGTRGLVLFDAEEKEIIGPVKGRAYGWAPDGRILIVRGRTLGMYDPTTAGYEKIFQCGVLSHSLCPAVGTDASFLSLTFESRSRAGERTSHKVYVDLREKEYVHQRSTAEEEVIQLLGERARNGVVKTSTIKHGRL